MLSSKNLLIRLPHLDSRHQSLLERSVKHGALRRAATACRWETEYWETDVEFVDMWYVWTVVYYFCEHIHLSAILCSIFTHGYLLSVRPCAWNAVKSSRQKRRRCSFLLCKGTFAFPSTLPSIHWPEKRHVQKKRIYYLWHPLKLVLRIQICRANVNWENQPIASFLWILWVKCQNLFMSNGACRINVWTYIYR